jgi:inosine-uridine nucleoside N-ribohydrolase
MVGLDVTHKALMTPDDARELRASGRVGAVVADLFDFYHRFHAETYGFSGSPVHDAVAVACLIQPGLLETLGRAVVVDCGGELSRGRTYVDLWGRTDWPVNAEVAVGIDADGFMELLLQRLRSLD